MSVATKQLRVLALVHRHLIPPATIEPGADIESAAWRTEYDVISTLTAMGHEVQTLGVHDDLGDIRRTATEWKPHIAFNLLEGFDDITIFDQNVVSHLELLKLSYTGCNPRGLLLARDKSLSKKLLAYHRIDVPEFEVFRAGRPIRRPKRLQFPLMVKSLTQEASIGISQASVVDSDDKLKERVTFIHESIGTAAIVEQYVEGRELYVGIIGNQVLQALPVWELFFTNMPEGARRIATDRVKWNVKYQKKYGIDSGPAKDLPSEQCDEIQHLCKRAYRALELSGYARIDLRLDDAGHVWVLEANPNPQIAKGEDFAASAEKVGMAYETVLQRIINLGLRWQPESVA
jgi:D-alanine-D-alanine ligase